MPHSSGGGSSGGGSHGGSSSHSGGGGYSSVPHHTIQRAYFVGASRYVYYRRGRAYYYYSDLKPSEYRKSTSTYVAIAIFAAVFLVFGIFLAYNSAVTPHKLHGALSTTAQIIDRAGIIQNDDTLYTTLQDFADKTGVIPIVVTCYNEDWRLRYGSLEDYAYDLYLQSCNDEYHWLLVYSTAQNGNPGNWYWEGMQGDNTDSVLHSGVLKTFNRTLHNNFSRNGSVGESFESAFKQIYPTVMDRYTDRSTMFAAVIFFAVVAGLVVLFVSQKRQADYFSQAEKIPLKAKEIVCEYCHGKFVHSNECRCPHCGAPESATNTPDD